MGRDTRHFDRSGVNKVQKDGGNGNRDFITDLPDCLITHILSCLPAKDAVRPCVLSKSWVNKWNSIYNIYVNSGRNLAELDRANLAKFVDGILLHVQDIRSVNLRFYFKYDAARINTWISTICRHNVESVAIIFPNSHYPGSIILPCGLLNCTSWRILELHMCCTLKVPARTCFLKLTSLNLKRVRILNDNPNTNTLKLDFPVLESLVLHNCYGLNMSCVEFCAPALHFFESRTFHLYKGCIIKILGERLAEFRSLGDYLGNVLLVGSTVVRAVLGNEGLTDSYEEQELQSIQDEGLKIRRLLN